LLLLVLFQAMGTAGKDATIEHVMSGVNLQGYKVFPCKQPKSTELRHDFLWRYATRHVGSGGIGIFNRSYTAPETHERTSVGEPLADIAHMEDYLTCQGRIALKFFLPLSRGAEKAINGAPRHTREALESFLVRCT